MQQIFNFFIRNSNNLLFLLLLGISLTLTIEFHSYHKSKTISSANVVTGNVYSQINRFNEYLHLKDQNEQLAFENAQLKRILFNKKDSVVDIKKDTLLGYDNIHVIQSKVIRNSYSVHENYLTLDTGAGEGVKPDMGVVNSLGIIGIVEKTSKHFATVLSILNVKTQINAKIKNSNHFGSLIWNGKNTGYVQLIDVPRLATVKKGDTVVTGGLSDIFPENVPVGLIEKVYIDRKSNFYTLDIRLFNDMTNLGYVYIIEDKMVREKKQLETETTKDE